MQDPKTNKGPNQRSINQDFGPSNMLPVYRPTTHNNQVYSHDAMVDLAYAPIPTDATVNQVGQASINQVYGHDATVNQVYGLAPPVYDGQDQVPLVYGQGSPGQGLPAYGQSQGPQVYGQGPPVYGQTPPVYAEKKARNTPPPPLIGPAVPIHPAQGSTFISLPEVIVNGEQDDTFKSYDFSDATIRRGFIRKVYSLVLLQLAITAAVGILIKFQEETKLFMMENLLVVMIVSVTIYFTTAICIHCCEGPRRRVPYNYIFLMMFTLALSLMVGLVTANMDGFEVLTAFGITMLIVVSLTIFAFQTKYDFTLLNGFLISFLLCLIITGFIAIFTYSEPLYLFYCALGILFFSFLLVYDTQLIIGGGHRYTISPEEYVFAALCIYLDIMNIFIRLLRIIR